MECLSAYELEYKLLPMLVASFNRNESLDDEDIMNLPLNIGILIKEIQLLGITASEIDINTISISTHFIDDTLNCILIEFPDPPEVPLAKYALIVVEKKETEIARYFTLEKSIIFHNIEEEIRLQQPQLIGESGDSLQKVESCQYTEVWFLCETQYESSHINYGCVSYEVSPENFINDVLSKFYNKKDSYRIS